MDNLLVKDVMVANIACLHPEMHMVEAVDCITNSHAPGLPVIDDHQHVVGFVSEHECLEHMLKATYYCEETVLVENIMQHEVKVARPDMTLVELIQAFLSGNIKVYPVVDESDGRLLGIITRVIALKRLREVDRQCYAPH